MKMGFKFQLPPGTVGFLIYGTLKCIYERTVRENEGLIITKQSMYGADISGSVSDNTPCDKHETTEPLNMKSISITAWHAVIQTNKQTNRTQYSTR